MSSHADSDPYALTSDIRYVHSSHRISSIQGDRERTYFGPFVEPKEKGIVDQKLGLENCCATGLFLEILDMEIGNDRTKYKLLRLSHWKYVM